jgi:hypothetical protein
VDNALAPDENFGDNAIAVPRLRPVLALAATESPLVGPGAAFVSLPLAVASLRGGAWALAPFQPPLLRVRRTTGKWWADIVTTLLPLLQGLLLLRLEPATESRRRAVSCMNMKRQTTNAH